MLSHGHSSIETSSFRTMKYYLIAGEASGDLHGANLIKALKQSAPESQFRCWGGDRMQEAGATVVKHYKDLAFMGFLEVVKNLKTILGNFKFCKQDIESYDPDVIIFIDYPGFNLRMLKRLRKNRARKFYYISPQIWAWHTSRVHMIKELVDRMFVILPFEKAFYEKYDVDVDFTGHPLLDELENRKGDSSFLSRYALGDRKIIALLPGSRKQEIKRMLSVMLTTVDSFPEYQFVVAGAPSMPDEVYTEIIGQTNIPLIRNETYSLLEHAHAALVTSGTATLETALFKVPQVVCYSGNKLSYQIARKLVKVDYISLVNLIRNKKVVTELIQETFNPEQLKAELTTILEENSYNSMQKEYELLHAELGGAGASKRAAELMIRRMKMI